MEIGLKFAILSNEPRNEISNTVVCATSKASDQPVLKGRLHRLVRVYTCQMSHCWKSHVMAQMLKYNVQVDMYIPMR